MCAILEKNNQVLNLTEPLVGIAEYKFFHSASI